MLSPLLFLNSLSSSPCHLLSLLQYIDFLNDLLSILPPTRAQATFHLNSSSISDSIAKMGANVPSATQRWEVFQFHPSSSPPPLTPVAGGSTAALEASRSEDQQLQQWSNSDSSVNAVSFGFVATAILVSMFLVMAIFERFLRSNSPASPSHPPQPGSAAAGRHGDVESGQGFRRHLDFNPKLGSFSPEMTVYSKGVSVLMPGEEVPTFIAYPAPVPCPPDRIHWPIHQHNLHSYPTPPNPNSDPGYSNRGSSSF